MRPEDKTVRELLKEYLAAHGNLTLDGIDRIGIDQTQPGLALIRVQFEATHPKPKFFGERELREAEERGYQRGLRERREQPETLCGALSCDARIDCFRKGQKSVISHLRSGTHSAAADWLERLGY